MALTAKRPSGFCECGCGEKTAIADKNHKANGYVKGWPRRFVDNHHRRTSPHEYLVDEETGCWVWQRSTVDTGYGQIVRDGKHYQAHRVFYEKHVGPIPDGMVLDHLCHGADKSCPGGDNCPHRRCVNPAHLEPVIHLENVRRGRGPKLTVEKVQEIRSLCKGGWRRRDIGDAFGVSENYVSTLASGEYWGAA